jgi:hypothetical protein
MAADAVAIVKARQLRNPNPLTTETDPAEGEDEGCAG